MELKNYFAQDSQGNILAMASVYVYQAGTQTLATGLKDKEGNAISNPFASDSSGLIQYAAENGIYDMRVSSGGRDYTLRVSFSDSAGIESDITKIIQSNSAGYRTDSGVEDNAYVVNLSPAVTSLSDGMIVSFTPAHTNTGESTLVVNGLTSQPIVGGALIALQGGEIAANGKVTCQYDLANTRWCIIASAGGAKQIADAQQSHHTPSLSQVQNMVAGASGDAGGVYDPAINYQTDTIGNAINRLITNDGVATPVSETSTLPIALSFSRKKEVRNAKPHADMPLDIHLSFEQATENTLNQIAGTAYTVNRDGYLKTTGTSSDQKILTHVSPKVPAFMVSAGVIFGGTATSYDTLKVGLMKDTSNWIMGQFNNKGNNVSLSLTLGGTQYSSIENSSMVTSFSLANYDRIGMSLIGNAVGLWVRNKTNQTWLLVSSVDITSAIDMHSVSLSGWYYAMWSYNDAGTAQYFYDFKAGPFGYVGLRDFKFVTTHDGKPFLADDGCAYMTATCGCTGSATAVNAICSSYMGVFKINLDTSEIKQIGAIFVNRSSKILFDHAAKLIYDRTTESWIIMVSTWGDYYLSVNCDIGYATLDFNPLHGVNTITALTKLNYNGSVSVYDPDVIYYNGMWYLVYIKGLGGPVGVRSASTFDGLFTATEQTLTMTETAEGPIVTVIGGALYILLGGLTAMAVYNSSLVKIGILNLTYTVGMTNKWPHPTIIPVNKPGGTIYKIVTFNQNAYVSLNGTSNQFSWGDVIIFESNMVSGREY